MLKKWMLLTSLVLSTSAWADVTASQAWSRITAPTVPTGAVFLQLNNTGTSTESLVSASSPVAKRVELHNHIHDNGVMRMREVSKIEVAAGKSVSLQPGGYHIMLMELKKPLKLNQTFPITLKYDTGRSETVNVIVNNGKGMDMKNGHDMNHGHMQH